MEFFTKKVWHETHAFLSTFKILLFGDSTIRKTAANYLFKYKFLSQEKYIEKFEKLDYEVTDNGKFKRIKLNRNIYFWPSKANLKSLKIVLAEASFPDHPHYYDSHSTSIQSGDRVLDIGACEGAFALHAAATASKVVAVEPSRTMIEAMTLAANEKEFNNIEFAFGLIGDTNGKVGFYENIEAPEASMIIDKKDANDFRECWTLDKFVDTYFLSGIDYIKCDAEGADFDILASGTNVLAKYKPKIAVAVYHSENDYSNIKNLLNGMGYLVEAQGIHYSPTKHKCWPILLKAVAID